MIIGENIVLAITALLSNKMRSLLTMLGIIIGISSVIAIMTVGESLTNSITSQMQAMGANNITVLLKQREEDERVLSAAGTQFGGGMQMTTTNTKTPEEIDYFTDEMIKNLCDTYPDLIYAISASESVGRGEAAIDNETAGVDILGANVGYFISNELDILAGNMFTARDFEEGRNVTIISEKAVEYIFDGDMNEAVGSEIEVSINGKYIKYTIIGVYKDEQAQNMAIMMGMFSNSKLVTTMYIPLITAMDQNNSTGYRTFNIVTAPDTDTNTFIGQVERFFEAYYRTNRDFGVSALTLESVVSIMTEMLSQITTAISVVAGIALLVGGIGVMNIMLVSITERTKEIGTRKALGATNTSIRIQFIVEAIIMCLIGGIFGIILGLIMGNFASEVLLDSPAKASISSILIAISFSMTIGLFFGYYPANKAAKMNPIDALRYE